jgi:1-acyl-sn-glycerol-3-phosphate acyltransferase
VEVQGRENLPPGGGFIIFANHRSLLDIPTVARATGRSISWVAKAALGRIPVFGWTLQRVHLLVDRGGGAEAAKQMVQEASQRLAAGEIMAIFPEGTRNKTETPVLPFKKGAFILAKHTGVPLVPLAIYNTGNLWPSGKYLPKPGRILAAIGEPLTADPKQPLAALAKKAEVVMEKLYDDLAQKTENPEVKTGRA